MAVSKFPNEVWNGVPANTIRNPADNQSPDYQDWDQIVAEMIAVQTVIIGAGTVITNPPVKAAYPGEATGTDAVVINKIVTILIDNGLCEGPPE